MWNRIKKIISMIIIIVLLPYIITVFANGKALQTSGEISKKDKILQDYCIRRLAQEVSSDYEKEMLKVQAVLTRTTIYKKIEEQGEGIFESEEFNEDMQVDTKWYQVLKQVWEETDGEVVMYGEELALVPFHKLSNGKTRSGKEVLGSDKYPYLQVIECPVDVEAEGQMASTFIPVEGVTVKARDSAGYALEVQVGEEVCNGESFRDAYQLDSSCVEVQAFEGRTRVITKGIGHGLGMSQNAANEMAKEGKNYHEILQFFFAGTEIKEVAQIFWQDCKT